MFGYVRDLGYHPLTKADQLYIEFLKNFSLTSQSSVQERHHRSEIEFY